MKNRIFENFARYFPIAAKKAESYHDSGYDTITVKLIDGEALIYDDFEKSVRRLPSNSSELTEYECRREFGWRLYKIMCRRGISQLDLSEMTGLKQSQISSYINGRHTPSFYIADKIAKALKCSLDDLRYFE